jgi:hypothetical protein
VSGFWLASGVWTLDSGLSASGGLGVGWDNIDVSQWASGEYIVGIRTEDEFGNAGWGRFPDPPSPSLPLSNPWLITVQSGR